MKGVIFTGLQASGKSTFYIQKFYKSHIRLSMDMLKTRNRESILLRACLESKQPVVIDNTNPTRVERNKYINSFKEFDFEIVGYYFSSSIEECLIRNSAREGKERIPDVGLRSTHRKLELPRYAEGFEQLYYVTLKNGEFIVEEWKDEIQ